ncbi:hypothetical protein [Marinibacterium sp. SX1]|uniref:hypothetical protein n=1 Tax=Marinibacterium sp. SX1 TaxID=3388424 RepID=UPI003D18323D
MTKTFRAALGIGLAALIPLPAAAIDYPTAPNNTPNRITISCFRGFLPDVIWDRPNSVFVDDLVKYGYDYPQAFAIAEAICRDEYGVNNQGYMTQRLQQLIRDTPPKG